MLKRPLSCMALIALTALAVNAKSYKGAELFSKGIAKYGRYDIRMRAVSGSGIISSFFLYYNESYIGSPEPWQEVDIEVLGKDNESFQSNIITGSAASKKTSEKMHPFPNISQSYNTYTVEWTPDYIAWFMNGKELRRTTGTQVTECQPKEMSCRFNLWISDVASWAGEFNPSVLPVYQYINWMTYSKYTPGAGTNGSDFTLEWRDDFDTFNTTRWGRGDWTFDGNMVDFAVANLVAKDGYCVICLTTSTATGFSGEVPKDLETEVQQGASGTPLRIHQSINAERFQPFSVSLDGRLLPQRSLLSNKVTGMSITAGSSSILQRIKISE